MMFPQTPFAQHTPNGPFGPPAALRTGSVSGAPPCDSNHYFHPLFNGFNAFGGPGAPGGPGGYYPGPPPGSKQARNSAAGDKGRTYQPSPLKPGLRKSSGSGAFGAPVALLSRPGSISMGSGPMPPGATSAPPLPPQVAMQRGYVPSQPNQHRGHQYHQGGPELPSRQRSNGIADDDIDCREDDVDVSPSQPSLQQQQAEPVVQRASLSGGYDPAAAAAAAAAVKASVRSAAAAAAAASASQQQPSQEAIDATAAAAVVVAAAAAAAASMSANPTPRSSLSGLPVLPPHRSSTTGIPAAALPTPSARTSCSGIAGPAVTASALGAALPDDHSATLTDALEHDVGDVDAAYGAAGYGAHGVPASWAFYDTAGGPGLAAALPGWQGMMQARGMYHAQVPTMAMPMQHSSAAASLQQPLLQAAMLQQLAGMGGMPTTAHMAAAVPGGYYHDSLQHTPDYMAAAEHLAQLQALQGSLIAQQNLRAAAAAAAAAEAPHMAPQVAHPAMGNPGLSHGAAGMLMNHPALLAGGLGHPGHNAAHPHMAALGMGTGMGARPRRNQQLGAGGSGSNGHSSPAGAGGAGDGQLRLNARQRRTLRRAKERAIRGLLEAGKLLVARTMGDGDDGTSGDGFDTDDVDEIPEGDMEGEGCDASPPRAQRQSTNGSGAAAMASPMGGPVAISRNASTGMAATTPSAVPPPPPRMSDSGIVGGRGQQELQQENAATSLATHVGVTGATVRSPSASSSNASSMFEGASSCGGVPSHASTHSAPSSGKASPLSAAVPAADGTAAGAAAAATASSSAATVESPVPSARSSKTSIGTPTASRVAPTPSPQGSPAATATGLSAASSAMAALAAGNTSEADITALIQQLNQKREEGLIDDKLMRDLEVRARCREADVVVSK